MFSFRSTFTDCAVRIHGEKKRHFTLHNTLDELIMFHKKTINTITKTPRRVLE